MLGTIKYTKRYKKIGHCTQAAERTWYVAAEREWASESYSLVKILLRFMLASLANLLNFSELNCFICKAQEKITLNILKYDFETPILVSRLQHLQCGALKKVGKKIISHENVGRKCLVLN